MARDRQKRVIKPLLRYGHADFIFYAFNVAEEIDFQEPKTYLEAIENVEKQFWLKAVEEEIASLMKNQAWQLVDRPKNQKVVGSK